MTSIDFFGIKERVVAILKADTTNLWWTNNDPSTRSKFRKIEAGSPSILATQEPPLPRCWVSNDSIVANIRDTAVVTSNAPNGKEYDYRINITFVVEAKDGPKTEEDIDDFTRSIINQLETNYDLRTPGGAESTRVAEASEVTQVMDLPAVFKGDRVRGRVIKFKVTVRA